MDWVVNSLLFVFLVQYYHARNHQILSIHGCSDQHFIQEDAAQDHRHRQHLKSVIARVLESSISALLKAGFQFDKSQNHPSSFKFSAGSAITNYWCPRRYGKVTRHPSNVNT
ncbi:hypothetical protein PILCRDRAFT_813479 [Piloderma croceum F 1598]|uniref:Secreted protein n=1 Tax=Piloderma croceum (strain F 1598) TaxID=765440 RepID=A0A0C3GD18_PILCF|nr:hypothetical protein PILCRDRAFT_813479 [Piloderma croceum F 1598]